MAVPKKNVNIHPPKEGEGRVKEMQQNATKKDTLLPKPISYKDLDQGFIDFVKNELVLDFNGDTANVVFLASLQRYTEFVKSWEFVDEDKNPQFPFITVIRKPDVQTGTHPASQYRIPVNQTYTYMRVPTWDGNRKKVDLYKIPRPVYVDLTFELRLFSELLSQLNTFSEDIQEKFSSIDYYVKQKGHYFPVKLGDISDESDYSNFENRRFYVLKFEMILCGYILDANDFEIKTATNSIRINEITD